MEKCKNYVIWLYLIIMLGYFPLYYKPRYVGMGDGKFKVFLYSSIACLGVLTILFLISYLTTLLKNKEKIFSTRKNTLSHLDMTVILYFAIVIISFLFSGFKQEAVLGADGWSMGLVSQMIFFLSYFYVSRNFKWNKSIITILLVSSSLVFLLGILHRFYIDPLSMYVGLSEDYRLQFLSTIGQSSWYSSFVCTVFPVGLYLFYIAQKRQTKIWLGIYCFLGFSTIVTQNTDSAFLAVLAVFIFLFYLSMDNAEKRKRFWECILMMLGAFKFMGILQVIFRNHSIALDTLSTQMSQGLLSTIMLIIVVIYYFCVYYLKKTTLDKPVSKLPFILFASLLGFFVTGTIIFVILNSNGFLLEKFGYTNTNNYLLFNQNWGNNRGFTWNFTMFSFKNMTFIQKIFGVGPDCYKAYHYSIPEYTDLLRGFWGELNLTNAHNEYLTTLINFGILGVLSYLTMLVTAIVTFFKARKKDIAAAGFALCLIAYMAHNIFCYQQVCCTPFIYIFMGLGMNLIRNNIKEKI